MKIYVVIRDVGKQEQDLELCKAFYDYVHAQDYADRKDSQLTSVQSHIFYSVEEIELVEVG